MAAAVLPKNNVSPGRRFVPAFLVLSELSALSGGASGAASVAVGISKTQTATRIAQAHGVALRLDARAQERPSPDVIMQL